MRESNAEAGHGHGHSDPEHQRKQNEREEARRQRELARTLVGMESVGGWGRKLWVGLKGVVAILGRLVGLVVLVVSMALLDGRP